MMAGATIDATRTGVNADAPHPRGIAVGLASAGDNGLLCGPGLTGAAYPAFPERRGGRPFTSMAICYRRVTALLHRAGLLTNHKRVERIQLKVPPGQPKRSGWLVDGSASGCDGYQPCSSYDFVEDRTHAGQLSSPQASPMRRCCAVTE
jgi:hypothetical protein